MSYSLEYDTSSEESTSYHSVSEDGISTPTMAQAADTAMGGALPGGERTLEVAYQDLLNWLATPEQSNQLQLQTLEIGIIAPEPGSPIYFDTNMFETIMAAYQQGRQSTTDSSITGPERDNDLPATGIVALWLYYNQGANAALRSARIQPTPKVEQKSDMRLPNPKAFTSLREELETFIRTLYVKFNMESSRFSIDTKKIAFASSFLDKDAKIWFTPYIDQDTGAIKFETYQDFLKELRRSFGDPNKISTAEYEIERLTQMGSIDLYYSRFKEYIDILNWSENQKIYRFRKGLKTHIQDLLINRNQYSEE